MKNKNLFLFGCIGLLFFLSGFVAQVVEDIPTSRRHYGMISNQIFKNSSPEMELGSTLNGINQIGFFDLNFYSDDLSKKAAFILWMKQRLEEVGRVVILDHVEGIDFTGVENGGWASLGGGSIIVYDFDKNKVRIPKEIDRYSLMVSDTIRVKRTNKVAPLEPIWQQEIFIEASNEKNREIALKDLVENLIDDLTESNLHYDLKPVFYIYIDTQFQEGLKKYLADHISPPLTKIPEEELKK